LPGFEYVDIYNFKKLSSILETGNSQIILNNKLGEISVDRGLTGKKGNGLLHIIFQKWDFLNCLYPLMHTDSFLMN